MSKSWDKKNIKTFGKKVKEFRIIANISQAQLAFECEIDVTQIARIERGEINTGITNVFRIAKALDISPQVLFIFHK